MNRHNFLLLLFFVLSAISSNLYAQKPQLWQSFKQPLAKIGSIQYDFKQEYRFELSKFRANEARFSLLSKKKLSDIFNGEFHYTYICVRSLKEIEFSKIHRFEFELNPTIQLNKKFELYLRNRYEVLKVEQVAPVEQNFRQRHQLNYQMEHHSLKQISIYGEVFFNINKNQVVQYRFVPLELIFKLPEDHSYTLFTMIRWRLSLANTWNPQFVIGSQFQW